MVEPGNLTVLIPFDDQGASSEDWQIQGVPTLLLVDQDGTIIERLDGNQFLGRLLDVLLLANW